MPDYTSRQFNANQFNEAQNRAYEVLAAICGPEVALAFSRYYGKSISPDQIVNTARQYGLWTAKSGMRGPAAQKTLLDQLGIPTQYSPEVNAAALQQAIAEGKTGAISTPNHYFFVQGYDPRTQLYDTGETGNVYRGGGRYLSLDQMRGLGGGLNGQFIASSGPEGGPPALQGNQLAAGGGYPPTAPNGPTGLPNFGGRAPYGVPAGTQTPLNQLRPGVSYNGGGVNYDDKESVAQYIRYAAAQRNIDPDVAVRVAQSEGLNTYVGDQGSSFGPYQLHYGGVAGGGNSVRGLGDSFTAATGLDARDPSTIQAQIDFTLDQVKTGGWSPWHGAARAGIGNYTGVGTYKGDPSQFGNYGSYVYQNQPNQPAGRIPTGIPSMTNQAQGGMATGIPTIQMGDMFSQGGNEYMYPQSPTVAPPVVGNANGWLTP